MLTKLSLKNVKSYKKESELHIAPITLIYGKNSSGKSTLWKFLEVIKQTLTSKPTNFFLNLDNPLDFSNRSTLTFTNKENSSFGFEFSKPKTAYGMHEKNPTLPIKSSNSSLNFEFIFKNQESSKMKDIYNIFEELEEVKWGIKSIEDLEIRQRQDIGRLNRLGKYKEAHDKLYQTQLEKIKENMEFLGKKLNQVQSIAKAGKESESPENFDDLFELNLKQDNKLFVKYKIIKIPSVYDAELPDFLKKSKLDRDLDPSLSSNPSVKKIVKKFNEKLKKRPYVRFERFVMDILKKEMGDKFEFNVTRELTQTHPVGVGKTKEQFNKTKDKKISKEFTYDAYGPLGPLEIKYNKSHTINHLFIPIEVSNDTSFWKDHFEMLQVAKEVMKYKSLDKNSKDSIMNNVGDYFDSEVQGFEHHYGFLPDFLPGTEETFVRALQALSASSLEEFTKIMAEELKYTILQGESFHPDSTLYGNNVLCFLFGWMLNTIQGSIENITDDDDVPFGPDIIPVVDNEEIQTKFSRANYTFHSYWNQLDTHFSQRRFFFNNIINANLNRSDITKLLSFVEKKMNDNRNDAAIISDVLERLQLPFKFKYEKTPMGKVQLSFINPKISGSDEKNISFYESGSGLTNLIPLVYFCIKNKGTTIIVEEPENKLHPNIQGNVAEFLCDINKNYKNNFIIETHSEHFILRLQKLIREKKIDKNLVAINYVYLDDAGEGSKVDHMQLDENGRFINKWRHGFFSERLKEL